ncbi:unnamed protein product [Owenia fusiformis]|uniref:Uncharacterized protein n=1 Tax=Owenia fusiformis TaxID=6347 RepID=A0A8J1TCU2_OWEFU|nr:unnamed protein product [Owenia fusiformis]
MGRYCQEIKMDWKYLITVLLLYGVMQDDAVPVTGQAGQHETDCRETIAGHEYQGSIYTTDTGRQCQHWEAHIPHIGEGSSLTLIHIFNNKSTDNFCRNPDPRWEKGPWCYTSDPNMRWDSCGETVPICACVGAVYNEATRSCYLIQHDTKHNYRRTYHHHKAECEQRGGHLVDINTKQEQEFISENVLGKQKGIYYTGGTKMADSNSWTWSDGKPMKFKNWLRGLPDVPEEQLRCIDEECSADQVTVLIKTTSLLKWTALSATSVFIFHSICEIEVK